VTTFRRLVTLVAAVITMGSPRLGLAQEKVSPAKAAPSASGEPRAEPKAQAGTRSKKVIHLEELKVEGRIQKPQAMFLMPRANLNYGDLDKGESFLPKVAEPLQKPPF